MEGREREVLYYKTVREVVPFREWRNRIRDDDARVAIDARVARFRGGTFGDSEPIGDGASESRIHFGPGYRIYYGMDGDKIVLLCGGNKATQSADIRRAKGYWKDYVVRNAELQRRSSKRFKK